MNRKSMFILGSVGVLALSVGFMKNQESSEILVKTQTQSEKVFIDKVSIKNGDQIKVVSVEEQQLLENRRFDESTTITIEEQRIVENSPILDGFVPQVEGTGFFFKKEN